MALLTAEDVLNKAFSKTKYREGFDQDEVDDFLDEVAHTIQSLTAERDDLAQRLAQAQAGSPTTPSQASAPEPEPSTEGGLLAAATDPTPPSATGMLAMAQKLHDEYVQAGESERDRLIDEAKVKAESIVEQAETDARDRMDQLATERTELETKIDDLRRFERDYRARLKSYLENLLGDLDHGAKEPSASSSAPAFDGGFGQASQPVAASAASVAEAPSAVSAAAGDAPSTASAAADEDGADAAGAPKAAESPWAQVRDQEPGAETPTPWGASPSGTSDVAQAFGTQQAAEDEQR
ncbi:DivIVA domain-containing protein [Demequina sp. NBRC 110053]|uniref:DivIVA domain-containing protein n=1 Tax=Demequina sp. NBRC 110053 TaxID=1570342 RepID=UPI0009FFCDB8|nr:DivIVA domain-containing protein [Demequina sp. NBRC 110053]